MTSFLFVLNGKLNVKKTKTNQSQNAAHQESKVCVVTIKLSRPVSSIMKQKKQNSNKVF